jgi:hypothetical protein
MYKRRRLAMPSLPSTPQSSHESISNSRFSSLEQSPFYRGQVSAGDDTAVVFASDKQLEQLLPSRLIYIDSTFRVVPSLYYQLFTVFVSNAQYVFPVLYALMTRKNTELYKAVLEKLHELIPEFRPSQVIADFEEAPTTAIRSVFGDAVTVSGCWFHYAQALIKKLKKIGLSDAYKNEEESQLVCRCLLSLPLLPVADIQPAFNDVKALVTSESTSQVKLDQLCRYVQRQWLDKSSIGPSRLSVRDNTSRTNNAVESFHAALRRRVQVAHPNLYTFLGHLQRMTKDSELEMARLDRGLTIRRPKKRVYVINDARIKTCLSRFDNGSYSRLQFLRAVSHSVGAHSEALCEIAFDSDSDDENTDVNTERQDDQHESSVEPSDEQTDNCEVCLINSRDQHRALVPCGHQRFCSSCIDEVQRQGQRCPVCRTEIQMVLRLY